jgi:hypothetical protein
MRNKQKHPLRLECLRKVLRKTVLHPVITPIHVITGEVELRSVLGKISVLDLMCRLHLKINYKGQHKVSFPAEHSVDLYTEVT